MKSSTPEQQPTEAVPSDSVLPAKIENVTAPMRMLFIKLRHIGDSLLLTPTIVATKKKYPNVEIWVIVRKSCDAILRGCPEIDRIYCTADPDSAKRSKSNIWQDLQLIARLRVTLFDFVFELTDNDRARLFAIAARTKHRCTNEHRTLKWFWRPFFHKICTTNRWPKHQVFRDYICPQEVLCLPEEPPPLRFEAERMEPWKGKDALGTEKFIVVHFSTRWDYKSWPLECWEEILQRCLLITPRILISCGPGEDELAATRLLISKLGERVFTTYGQASWAELAWLLHKASFFLGVDTAAMHLAAAVGCPTVCLFGPSPEFEYHPWRVKYWMIRPQDWIPEEAMKKIPREKIMQQISIEKVWEACQEAAHFSKNLVSSQS